MSSYDFKGSNRMKDQKKTRLVFLLNVAHRAVDRWIESSASGEAALSPAQAGTLFYLSRKPSTSARRQTKVALSFLNARLNEGFSEDEMAVVGRWLETVPQRLIEKSSL
jgi:hypothetical protein